MITVLQMKELKLYHNEPHHPRKMEPNLKSTHDVKYSDSPSAEEDLVSLRVFVVKPDSGTDHITLHNYRGNCFGWKIHRLSDVKQCLIKYNQI